MEVIRQSALGVEVGALHSFGDDKEKNILDYDDNDDLFPDHNVVEPLIKSPSAPLGSDGLAPVVADGHRARDDHGENNVYENIAPPVPLAGGGIAPLVISDHRARDGKPLHEAAAAEKELLNEAS